MRLDLHTDTAHASTLESLSALSRTMLSRYQHGFPMVAEPWRQIAEELGCSDDEVRAARREIEASGLVARLGAVVRPGAVGASTLAAMRVPAERLESVAALVNDYRGVNHNYEREDAWNLWFVATAPDEVQLQTTLQTIAERSGCPLLDCRLEKPYHIDLGFPL